MPEETLEISQRIHFESSHNIQKNCPTVYVGGIWKLMPLRIIGTNILA
jgi:hypothetical protein